MAIYFTRPVILLSLISFIWVFFRIKKRKNTRVVQLLVILLVFGITHNLVFRNMAYIHDYMIIYLTPFLALSSSFVFFMILEKIKLPQNYLFFAASLLLILVARERITFTKTLINSSGFAEGVELGKIINQNTFSKERVLVLSPDFKNYFEVFTGYYASREIDYILPQNSDLKNTDFLSRYGLIVAIPSRDTAQHLIDILQKRFKTTTINKFIIAKTNDGKTPDQNPDFNNYPGI